jgi:formate/nitrite transporter FocA (FNT family)
MEVPPSMAEVFGFDCYSPKEIAEKVENVGVAKANLPLVSMVALGVLAGGFIGLGSLFATLVGYRGQARMALR